MVHECCSGNFFASFSLFIGLLPFRDVSFHLKCLKTHTQECFSFKNDKVHKHYSYMLDLTYYSVLTRLLIKWQ